MSLKKQVMVYIFCWLGGSLALQSGLSSLRAADILAVEQSSRPKNIYLENWSCILIQGGQTGCFCCLKYLKDVTVHQ